LKQWVDFLQSETRKLLKQWLDLGDKKKTLKQWIDLLQYQHRRLLKQPLDFPIDKKIETMDRLAKFQAQKIVETTLKFPNR